MTKSEIRRMIKQEPEEIISYMDKLQRENEKMKSTLRVVRTRCWNERFYSSFRPTWEAVCKKIDKLKFLKEEK